MDFGFRISDFGFGNGPQAVPIRRAHFQSAFRSAFSFTEVMFAVVILGVGFIMVAAIFPVALQQAKNTAEDVAAASVARSSASFIGSLLTDKVPGATGTTLDLTSNILPTHDPSTPVPVPPATLPPAPLAQIGTGPIAGGISLWDSLSGNLISSEDPRNAFVVLYRREGIPTATATNTWSPFVQLYIFPVQSRATPRFDRADTELVDEAPHTTNPIANLMARPVLVAIANDVLLAGGVDLIAFEFDQSAVGANALYHNVQAAAEGAYVVISRDNLLAPNEGRMNGRMYRLGTRRAELDLPNPVPQAYNPFSGMTNRMVYELQIGNDFNPDPGDNGILGPPNTPEPDDIVDLGMAGGIRAEAFLIGRGFSSDLLDKLRNGQPILPADIIYSDAVMPVGAFTTFVKVKQ